MIQWTSIIVTGLIWALSVHYRLNPVYCTGWFIGSTAITYYYARRDEISNSEEQVQPCEDIPQGVESEA